MHGVADFRQWVGDGWNRWTTISISCWTISSSLCLDVVTAPDFLTLPLFDIILDSVFLLQHRLELSSAQFSPLVSWIKKCSLRLYIFWGCKFISSELQPWRSFWTTSTHQGAVIVASTKCKDLKNYENLCKLEISHNRTTSALIQNLLMSERLCWLIQKKIGALQQWATAFPRKSAKGGQKPIVIITYWVLSLTKHTQIWGCIIYLAWLCHWAIQRLPL